MTSIKNHKTPTILVAIAALAGVLVVSTVAIGNERIALAAHDNDTITSLNTKRRGVLYRFDNSIL